MPTSIINSPFGIVGFSKTMWEGFTLPQNLGIFGFLGCTQYVAADFSFPLTNMGGSATWDIEIPSNPNLIGMPFYTQGVVIDFGANPGNAIVTNAGEGVLGAR